MENQTVQHQISRPEAVGVALKLLYVTFGIGVVRGFTVAEAFIDKRTAASGGAMLAVVSVLVIMCLCIYKTGKGRNWARIISLALAVISTPFSVFKNLQNLTIDPVFGIFGVGQAIFVIAALFILFQKSSNDWFREMKTV